MKQLYPKLVSALCLLFLFVVTVRAQCPAGYVPDEVAFDTSISFSSGHFSRQLKFPKFDPSVGMVTCARLTMTMTGRLNQLKFENEDPNPNTASAVFNRYDTLSGPGLTTSLKNSETKGYGPYSLDPSDGNPDAGTDYVKIGPEDIFARTRTVTITDAAVLSQFYGAPGDSLVYQYNVFSQTNTAVTGGWLGGASTSGTVNYKIEFCYCPAYLLPLNVKLFEVTKVEDSRASLSWKGFDEEDVNYNYEVQVSSDGVNFKTVNVATKNNRAQQNQYNFTFTTAQAEKRVYYFRIRQVYGNGYSRFSDTRTIQLEGKTAPKFNLYPNPSSGIVGIKFDNVSAGKYYIQITNAQGQTVLSQQVQLAGNTYRELGQLGRGIYWIKVTDVESTYTGVHQLMIK